MYRRKEISGEVAFGWLDQVRVLRFSQTHYLIIYVHGACSFLEHLRQNHTLKLSISCEESFLLPSVSYFGARYKCRGCGLCLVLNVSLTQAANLELILCGMHETTADYNEI